MTNILETILWWLVSGVDPGLPVSQPPAPRLGLWRWWMRSPWRKILKWTSSFGSVSLTCSVQSLDPSSDEDPRSCRTSRSEESARPRRYPWESCHRTPSEKQKIILCLMIRGFQNYLSFTSHPVPGEGPSQPGGGPPYFLWPVVTSRLYPAMWLVDISHVTVIQRSHWSVPVLSRIALILSSSGPWWGWDPPLVTDPPALVFWR